MSTPRVTIITACHNYGHWLFDALSSAVGDPWSDKRLMVVDDGSSDGTSELVCDWMENPQPWTSPEGIPGVRGVAPGSSVSVTLISCSPARGPSAARNVAIRAMWEETDLFFNLDADDIYRPGKIGRSVARWQESPGEIGVVYTDYDNWSTETNHLIRQYRPPYTYTHLRHECIVNPNSLISKKALAEVGLFDEEMRTAEDWDLWLRIAKRYILVHIPESLVVMRVGKYNSTNTVAREIWEKNWRRIAEKHGNG